MTITIRKGDITDLPAALDMSERFYATTDYGWTFDRESVERLGFFLLQNGIVLIAEQDGVPIGMTALVVSPFPFNNAITTAAEVVWWVNEEARGSGAGAALFQAIEPAARAAGAHQVEMIHLRESPHQAGEIYRRAGFAETHTSFTRRL